MKRSFVVFGLMALALSACSYETQEPNKGLCGVGVDDKELGKANICECAENVTEKCDAIVLGQGNHLSSGHWKCDTTNYSFHKCVAECDNGFTYYSRDNVWGCYTGQGCSTSEECDLEQGAMAMTCLNHVCVIASCYEGLGPKDNIQNDRPIVDRCSCGYPYDHLDTEEFRDWPYETATDFRSDDELLELNIDPNHIEELPYNLYGILCILKGCRQDAVEVERMKNNGENVLIDCHNE